MANILAIVFSHNLFVLTLTLSLSIKKVGG